MEKMFACITCNAFINSDSRPHTVWQQSSSVLSFGSVDVALFCDLVFTDLTAITLFLTPVETEANGVRFKRFVSGGNLSASQDGHNMRSPCVDLTVLLFTRFRQGRSGKPNTPYSSVKMEFSSLIR